MKDQFSGWGKPGQPGQNAPDGGGNCIDPRTPSRTMVTTRISGLVPGAMAEFSLGLLAPDDAVARRLSQPDSGRRFYLRYRATKFYIPNSNPPKAMRRR